MFMAVTSYREKKTYFYNTLFLTIYRYIPNGQSNSFLDFYFNLN